MLETIFGKMSWLKVTVGAGIGSALGYVADNVPLEVVVSTTQTALAAKGFWGGAAAAALGGAWLKFKQQQAAPK